MSLKYALFSNHLTADPHDYMALAQDAVIKTEEDIIDLMISRGSTVTKAEALSVLEEYATALTQVLEDGNRVNTSLFNVAPSIIGVFNDLSDNFDAARHSIKLNVTPGVRLKKVSEDIKATKVIGEAVIPILLEYYDYSSDTMGELSTATGPAFIRGANLKIDPEDPEQGVYFVNETGTEFKVPQLLRNKPKELLFMNPEGLTGNSITLEVRNKSKNSKTLRSGNYPSELKAMTP